MHRRRASDPSLSYRAGCGDMQGDYKKDGDAEFHKRRTRTAYCRYRTNVYARLVERSTTHSETNHYFRRDYTIMTQPWKIFTTASST